MTDKTIYDQRTQVEQLASLAKFADAVLNYLWDGAVEIDAGDVQDLAVKYGLVYETKFDPDEHTDHEGVGVEAGDPWFMQCQWLIKLAREAKNAEQT